MSMTFLNWRVSDVQFPGKNLFDSVPSSNSTCLMTHNFGFHGIVTPAVKVKLGGIFDVKVFNEQNVHYRTNIDWNDLFGWK